MRVLHCVAVTTPFRCIGIVYNIRKEKFLSTVLSIDPIILVIISLKKKGYVI